eukprot:jgi/Bigna1/75636/fgenesh1_pg.36_\
MENGLLSPAHEISNSACTGPVVLPYPERSKKLLFTAINNVLTGQLLRKCPKRVLGKRVWQKRFFVLEPEKRTIAYYANSKTGTMPMGVIAVQAIRGVNNVEESKKNYTSRFTIDLTGDWLFELRAQSRAEKERWLLAVKDMLKENVEFRHILEKFKHSKYWKPSIYQKLADDIEKERKRTQKIYDADAKKATKDSHRRKTIAREVQSAVESYAGVSRVNSQRRSKIGGMVSEVGGSHSRQISGLPPKKRQQMKSLLSVIQSREAVPGLRDSMHSSQEAGRATGVASTISHNDTLQMMKKDRSSSSNNNNNNSSNDSNNGTLKGRSPLADVTQKASKGGGGGEGGGDARGKEDGGGGEGGGSNDNKLRHSRGRSRGALTTDNNNRSPRSRSHSRSRSSRGKSKGGGGNGDRIVAAPNQQPFEIKMSEVVGSQQQQQHHRPIVNIKAGPAETPFPTKSRTSSTNHRTDDNKLPPSSSSSGIMPNPVKGYNNNSKIPLIVSEQPQQQQRQQHRHHYLRGHRAPNYDNMISSNNLHTRLQQPIILNSGINLDDQLLHTGGGSTLITTSTQPGNNTSSSHSNEAHPMQPRPNHHQQQPRDHNHHQARGESSPISLVIDKATSMPTATNNGEANRHSHNHRYGNKESVRKGGGMEGGAEEETENPDASKSKRKK